MRAVLVTAVLLLAGAAPAAAQVSARTVEVPLDRSGAVAGTVELRVARYEGRGPDRGTLLALSGGPGQSGADSIEVFATALYGAFTARGYDVVSLDQRGTGVSALECPSLQNLALTDVTVPPPGTIEVCAERLGPARAFYATTDTVADLEAVRDALGVERWTIAGISYGTYVAERYARAFPDRVERLVLDSVVPQDDVDPLLRPSLRLAGTVLRGVCAGGRCRGITRDPVTDLTRLVRRMAAAPLRARIAVDARGTRRTATLDGAGLFDLFVATSFDAELRAALPGLVRAALDGDDGPLVQAAAVSLAAARVPARALSQGLHVATICADVPTPWGGPGAPLAGRAEALAAAAAAAPDTDFLPFDRTTATGNGLVQGCLRWAPVTQPAPPAPGPLPAVPTLLLTGQWDLSTPPAEAFEEAANAPGGQVVVVPRAGHNVINGSGGCAAAALRQFARRARVSPSVCRRQRPELPRPARVPAR